MKRKPALKKILLLCLLAPVAFSLHSLSLDETLTQINSISNTKNVQFRWDPLFRSGIISSGDHFGAFTVAAKDGETGYLLLNNRELFNVPLPYNSGGRLDFPQAFVDTLKASFTRLHENDASRFRVSTIIIDPGHGGRDPGAVATHTINGKRTQVYEKDIVLSVGLALRDRLYEAYPDKRILMTRDTDVFRSLEQRSDMANAVEIKENESVIFISIHANASVNTNARGYEVWHITSGQRRQLINPTDNNYSADIKAILERMLEEEFTTESILLADRILQGFGHSFGSSLPSRGRKANDWFVVRNSRMPAILVELGFVSNRQDAVLMTSPEGLQKLTDSLYNGVTNFIGIFER
ncbi:MAG: N-acetylmuramoyl-L-alanine amidase [Treponema sp.]|jgi:N-acetylmuramoyl-L-alanine amidase|nr:N-acetylmuramoyl-L-alanine amidase [Treponema sp.]